MTDGFKVDTEKLIDCSERFFREERMVSELISRIRRAESIASASSPERLPEYRSLLAWAENLKTYFHNMGKFGNEFAAEVGHMVRINTETIRDNMDEARKLFDFMNGQG